MTPLLLLVLQAATPQAAPPTSFSILAPVAQAPCKTRLPTDDIVVCATNEASVRLPLPAERGPPSGPTMSNPNLDGRGAMDAAGTPCSTLQGGCQAGVDVFGAGTAAVRLIGKLFNPDSCCETAGEATNPVALVGDLAGGVGRMFKKKPDKSGRVAIPLDDPAPVTKP